MPTLSQLRRRVDALKRKYAKELAVVRLRRLAQEFSHQWARDVAERRPAPQPQPFIRRIAQHGFRLNTFMALHLYLERCRREADIPDSLGIISNLLPQIPFERLRQMLRWDAPARPSDYPSFLRRQEPLAPTSLHFPTLPGQSHYGLIPILANPRPPMLNSLQFPRTGAFEPLRC